MRETRSRFIKIKCNECGQDQNIFGCAATTVRCLICDKVLATPTGGKAQIHAQIMSILDKNI